MTARPDVKKRTFTQEFIDFLKTFGVIGVAIAFVIGLAATALVNSFVKDIIDPFIGLFLPAGGLASTNSNSSNSSGRNYCIQIWRAYFHFH